mmetsp:Transcript_28263/g.70881  ORF Transcript_28263/g.70881 Transcript_28263/m.70881 type:complete len:226 (+) Transcript_28263:413-1090(+)
MRLWIRDHAWVAALLLPHSARELLLLQHLVQQLVQVLRHRPHARVLPQQFLRLVHPLLPARPQLALVLQVRHHHALQVRKVRLGIQHVARAVDVGVGLVRAQHGLGHQRARHERLVVLARELADAKGAHKDLGVAQEVDELGVATLPCVCDHVEAVLVAQLQDAVDGKLAVLHHPRARPHGLCPDYRPVIWLPRLGLFPLGTHIPHEGDVDGPLVQRNGEVGVEA